MVAMTLLVSCSELPGQVLVFCFGRMDEVANFFQRPLQRGQRVTTGTEAKLH
jgi:hypothetical protein